MKVCFFALSLFLCALSAYSQCPTADEVAVQTMLDNAAAAGGGVVQLDPRVYTDCYPLIVKSNVHLRGAGRGATIIRGTGVPGCITVNNSDVCANIGAVAATNVTISNLTIDNLTNRHDANGIEFVPSDSAGGQSFDSQPVTNSEIDHVQILGASAFHDYLIWNFKGQHIKITNNWLDGGSTSDSNQEGIESYGGHDVVIANNTIQNIGDAGINLGSAGLQNTETIGISAVDNFLSNCHFGIHIGTANIDGTDQYNLQTLVRGNIITSGRFVGIDVYVRAGTHEQDLDISHNTIRNIVASDQAAGIRLTPDGTVLPSAISNLVVDGNLIGGIKGSNAQGIRIGSLPNARVIDNSIVDTDDVGIYAVDAANLEITRNRIERSGSAAILAQDMSDQLTALSIERNVLADWLNVAPAILVIGARTGQVHDNTYRRSDGATPTPLIFDSSSCSIAVSDDQAWYLPGWVAQSTLPCH